MKVETASSPASLMTVVVVSLTKEELLSISNGRPLRVDSMGHFVVQIQKEEA